MANFFFSSELISIPSLVSNETPWRIVNNGLHSEECQRKGRKEGRQEGREGKERRREEKTGNEKGGKRGGKEDG
jgi:hypothetical protein